jgi:hypothetical protein
MISFKEFRKNKFVAYKNQMTSSLSLTKGEDRLVYWSETQEKPSLVQDREVMVYGEYPDTFHHFAYAINKTYGYVNTGHAHALVEAKNGQDIEQALYEATCFWEDYNLKLNEKLINQCIS